MSGGRVVCRERTLLLVGTSICGAGITSLSRGNDTSLCQQGVGEGRFAVVDVSNNTHVTHIGRLLHESVNLIDGEAAERAHVSKQPSSSFVCILDCPLPRSSRSIRPWMRQRVGADGLHLEFFLVFWYLVFLVRRLGISCWHGRLETYLTILTVRAGGACLDGSKLVGVWVSG